MSPEQLHIKAARVALDAAMSHLAKAALELRQTGSGRNHGIMADWHGMIGRLAMDSVEIAETADDASPNIADQPRQWDKSL